MVEITCRVRPISNWPGERRPADQRKSGERVFGLGYAKTLLSLEREARYLKSPTVIIEADFREQDIRIDGWPRAGANPATPEVVVDLQTQHGPLRIPCDYFRRWEHNLRAIALHLERLRLANNYGVGEHGEQYRGWRQIAAPPARMTLGRAAALIVEGDPNLEHSVTTSAVLSDVGYYRSSYRRTAARLHPDVGGDPERWLQLQEAKAILDEHHKPNANLP